MSDIDFSILEYINNFDFVHIDDILNKFPDDKFSTKYRLEVLSKAEKHPSEHFYLENTSYIELNYIYHTDKYGGTFSESDNTYSITEKGKLALQEYKYSIKNNKIYTFKHSFLYPIISAIITAMVTTYITSKFLSK